MGATILTTRTEHASISLRYSSSELLYIVLWADTLTEHP